MINIAMWGKALTLMPKIEKDEWDRLDIVSRWLIATRSAVIVMTFTSAAFAGLLAYRDGQFDAILWLLCCTGLCLAHATNNLINDFTDTVKGVDESNYFRSQYGAQPLEKGLMTKRELLTYAAITGLVALACGLYLVHLRGEIALTLLAAGAFFVLFYTWPLKYIGLGEPTVLVVWGPLMVGGTYFIVTGTWDWQVCIASLAYGLAPTAVLFGKHVDKIEPDSKKGIRTMPVLLGEKLSRWSVMLMFIAQFAVIIYLVATGFFHPVMLITLGALWSLKTVWRVYAQPKPDAPPEEFPKGIWPLWFVAAAFWYTRRFGILFLIGLIADTAITLMG